jgi:hypothetical protein
VTASDLYDWKRHPVTQAVLSTLQERVAGLTAYLQEHAGKDPAQDRYYSGAITAHNDLLNISFEDIEEPQEQ